MKKTLVALSLAALTVPALAQDKKAPEPSFTITGNVGLVSDYRFRGISQNDKRAAIQGGFDFAHKSGFYIGNWNSNVSSESTAPANGSIEMDYYAGYKFELGGVTFDIGTIYYDYPGSTNFSGSAAKIDTHEIYVGVGYGPVSFKVSNTLSNSYFGLGKDSLTGYTSAKGTLYYDLSASYEIAPKTVVSAHVGYLDLDGDTSAKPFKLTDYKVGISYDAGFATLGLAYITNDINSDAKGWFTNGSIKNYKDTAVVSITKTF